MKQHKKMIIAPIVIFVVIMVAGMFGVVRSASSGDKILDNVYIDTVYVGGMTQAEAKKAIDTYIEETKDVKITLKAGEKSKSISAEKAGIEFNGEKAVEDAYGAGRDGNLFSRFIEICKLKKSNDVINLETTITEEQAKSLLETYEKKLIIKMQNASLERKNGEFEVIDAKSGQQIEYDESVKAVCDHVSAWDKKAMSIEVSVEEEKPKYTADDLKRSKRCAGYVFYFLCVLFF